MYNKVCKVCGTPFQAVNPNYSICSDVCRKIQHNRKSKEYSKIYYSSHHGKKMRHDYHVNHYKSVDKHCTSCGAKLEDGRQSYCLNCLLNDYVNNKSLKAAQRLYNRGFDSKSIKEALKNREGYGV